MRHPLILRDLLLICGATAMLISPVTAAPASAQGSAGADDDTVIVTFSAPVTVPGTTLPPGTYEFTQQDSNTHQQVVQIFKEGRSDIVTTVVTVPVYRLEQAEGVIIRFAETPEGTPPALKAYFYPGQRVGHRFVYPEEQARRIAEQTKTLVLSGDVDNLDAGALDDSAMRVVNERGESMAYAEGAVDWASRDWKDAPTVTSGEQAPARAERRRQQANADDYANLTSVDARRQLVDDTASIVGNALDQPGAAGDTVTVSRDKLEKIHRNLESLREAFGSHGETD